MGVLDGRVAIVTGAGQGIGRGIALALGSEGARVTVADLDADNAERVAKEITERGAQALAYPCDIRDSQQVDACVTAAVERFGGLHILVNNAMAARSGVPLEEATDQDLALALATGPGATLSFMRAAFPHLKGDGRIINLRSGSELQGLPGFGTYIAGKAAVGGLTKAAAREWGQHGITVNAIAPFASSESMRRFFDQHPRELEQAVAGLSVKRVGDPEHDIGRAAVYLAGPDAGYVTGLTLHVDGGGSFE
ncbi:MULTISPECIES: SDR family NAD(P)-dependent oxidoreductase [unclassified Pseudofrankia]|uniref:SDR family NAD(P)-dependent oxidoreductase n=1 Tax=unclassified Pseudofrankia TaxID=2994372 RepID=UPI0008D92921|nr:MULTISPECIES: SDR family NAD(P)-dependent oxidoreductase [unclassified Pseudofrankia]MDT3446057.1 SDR family NAD(P)-dependent oxidoreductase [Pseudofrankia sp. BMG5.37]OHV55383.1 short-chain dehydrogenase [Pseudofrankia sp. BMG5.36]